MHHRYRVLPRAFTLIELLVVIAIIGILSSIVLASLNTARNKGNDAAIKANLATVAKQAELWYADHNYSYVAGAGSPFSTTTCPTGSGGSIFNGDTTILSAMAAAVSASGSTYATVTRCAIGTGGQSYAAAVRLKDGTNWFCVDSSGSRKTVGSTPSLGGGASTVAQCP